MNRKGGEDVTITLFSEDTSWLGPVMLGASGVEVSPATSLLLRKVDITSCGFVGSKGCCTSCSSFPSSNASLYTASCAAISPISFCIFNYSNLISCSAMAAENFNFSSKAARLARHSIRVSLREFALVLDLAEDRELWDL